MPVDPRSVYWLPVRLLLLPVALLYGVALQARNRLYDWGWFKARRFPVPVISVGNLSAGGSGKTPLTIFLAQQLAARYGRVAVVSRGYGRSTRGPQLVSDGERILLSADQAGDEPLLIARKTGAVVAVAEQRNRGIERVLQTCRPAVILLDDAFQHRQTARDLDILLVNPAQRWLDRLPLPGGFYREFAANICRADVVILTKNKTRSEPGLLRRCPRPWFQAEFHPGELTRADFKTTGPLASLKERPFGAFCGIAHPESFGRTLKQAGLQPVFLRAFPDHVRYTQADMKALVRQAVRQNCRHLVCTEKDLVKIAELDLSELNQNKIELWALTQRVEIIGWQKLQKKLQQLIDKSG